MALVGFENIGYGLGIRSEHFDQALTGEHEVEWFEAITENFLGMSAVGHGPNRARLRALREKFPIVLHGISLSVGGSSELSLEYLKAVKDLIDEIQPAWVSDHLCWTGVHGRNSHDLLPLPYTQETIEHVVRRIQTVQEIWRRPLAIENVSSYVEFPENEMSEAEFVSEVVEKSGCGLLLDVNNIYVSAHNHRFDPLTYFNSVPWKHVVQFHIAGHQERGTFIIDTHGAAIRNEVWDLYREATRRAPHAATLIERDNMIPEFSELARELDFARTAAFR